MKTKVFLVTLFAILALGTVFVGADDNTAETSTALASFEEAASGYNIQPMGGCTRICTKCLPIGHGGACTTSGSCC